jgi:hypothetical protein
MPSADRLAQFPIGMVPQRRTGRGTPAPAIPEFQGLVETARRVYAARRRHYRSG